MYMTKFPAQCAPKRADYRSAYMNELFNRGLGQFFGTDIEKSIPSVNVLENAAAFELQVAAPGYHKEDFLVDVANETLTISVTKETAQVEEGKTFRRREFHYGNFRRSFRLSEEHLDTEAIQARYENGMLLVTIPKKETAKAPVSRRVDIV